MTSLISETIRYRRRISTQALTMAALAGVLVAPAAGQLNQLIFDGFGDADINNNGVSFESDDTNIGGTPPMGEPNTYVPGRLEDINGDGPANPEITAETPGFDPSDTGISWFNIDGFTNGVPGTGSASPTIRILDDTQGAMQETMASGLNVPAINSGFAASWESRGGGTSGAGFFPETVSLGPNEGDEIRVSFDFRLWRDAPNVNSGTPGGSNDPVAAELRFGLFQDTDDQLGQTNPIAGRIDELGGFTPAVWGQEAGQFNGELTGISNGAVEDGIGSNGDNGWTASVFFGDSISPNGGGTRIREELQSDSILEGSDGHTIVQPENINPDPFGVPMFDFVTLDDVGVYNIALSLVRATVETPGDSITSTLILTDAQTGAVLGTLSGTEDLEDSLSGGAPVPGTGGIQSDSWDYFALRTASNGSSEFDFIIDNFLVETSDDVVLGGDFNGDGNVDAADYTVWRDAIAADPNDDSPLAGAGVNDGVVDEADFDRWLTNFGQSSAPSFSLAIPEPTTTALATLLAATGAACGRRRY